MVQIEIAQLAVLTKKGKKSAFLEGKEIGSKKPVCSLRVFIKKLKEIHLTTLTNPTV